MAALDGLGVWVDELIVYECELAGQSTCNAGLRCIHDEAPMGYQGFNSAKLNKAPCVMHDASQILQCFPVPPSCMQVGSIT